MSFVFEFVLEGIAEIVGQALFELVVRPLHWMVWATGVAVFSVISLGRFQVEPFAGGEEWLPQEEGGPILYTCQATTAGTGIWIILLAALFRQFIH